MNWNLPPGCTQAEVDREAGGYEMDRESYCDCGQELTLIGLDRICLRCDGPPPMREYPGTTEWSR